MGTVNFNTRSGCTQNIFNRTASKYTLWIWLETDGSPVNKRLQRYVSNLAVEQQLEPYKKNEALESIQILRVQTSVPLDKDWDLELSYEASW